jgi:hypothetical protein
MEWADVTRPPSERMLRQFAGLCLVFFVGAAAWHVYRVHPDGRAAVLGALGLTIGGLGVWRPKAIRYVYTGWMMLAFPIGWTVSKITLGALFFVVFTGVAWIFKLAGRDSLRLKAPHAGSFWIRKRQAVKVDDYLRQF